MPSVMDLKAEDIDTSDKRARYTLSVIDCGLKGTLYATAFGEAGFKVICTDADQSLLKKFVKGKTAFQAQEMEVKLKNLITKGQVTIMGELKKAVSLADVIIIGTEPKIDDRKKTDSYELVNVCKQAGAALHSGVLVIYGGIAGLNFTEGIIKETLENTSGLKVGRDFGFAYVPLYISETQPIKLISDLELKISGPDKTSRNTALTLLKTIAKSVKEISDIKTAEIVTLFTVAKQDADTALANEMAVFCESAGANFFEILKFMGSNIPDFYPKALENQNQSEPYLLLESADNLNVKLRLPTLVRQVNEDMVKHSVNLIQNALHNCGKTLRRARVAVLGAANPRAEIDAFVKLVEAKGAKVSVYDQALRREPLDSKVIKASLNEAVEGTDCIVILASQKQLKPLNLKKLKATMKNPSVIIDLTGALEQQRVETEGFIYRGLGKGNEKN